MSPSLPIGTQVVVGREVRGTNGAPLHPRGAVGIVVRTPAGAESAYLVRLPDGFEATFVGTELEVLKHFRNRLPGAREFALEDAIILRCVVGSRAYGLEGKESDEDIRGVYLAPAEMHWSLFGTPEQFEDNQAQTCYWELQKFLVLALKANPNVLECLYSPLVRKLTPVGDRLLALREAVLSQMIFQTFNGYALSQFKKLEQDLRNQGEIRWKHAMHLIRLLLTGAAALRESRIPVRVEAHRDRLLAIKSGMVPWAEVEAWRRELHADFERALRETTLPERPDYEAVNEFLVATRREAARAEDERP